MLHRVRVWARFRAPLYPFTPSAVHEYGERRGMAVHNGYYEYEDDPPGPPWVLSHEQAIRNAIAEVEQAAASLAALLDQLRQQLLEECSRPLPAEGASAIAGPGESAAGGRDVTPAGQVRRSGTPAEA